MEFNGVCNHLTGLWGLAKEVVNPILIKTKGFARKYGATALSLGLVVGFVSFGGDFALAEAAATMPNPKSEITTILADAKLIGYGILAMLITLFAVKLWKRVFGS